MEWVETVLRQLDGSLECQSEGTISWRFIEDENCLLLAPSVIEIVGGAEDGETVYPFYSLAVSQLVQVFDELPDMHWDTMNDEFSLEGKIDGARQPPLSGPAKP